MTEEMTQREENKLRRKFPKYKQPCQHKNYHHPRMPQGWTLTTRYECADCGRWYDLNHWPEHTTRWEYV
jgi:hypothetical protein